MARGHAKIASSTADQVAFRGIVYGAGGYRCPRPIKDVHVLDELHIGVQSTSRQVITYSRRKRLIPSNNLGPWPKQNTHMHPCMLIATPWGVSASDTGRRSTAGALNLKLLVLRRTGADARTW